MERRIYTYDIPLENRNVPHVLRLGAERHGDRALLKFEGDIVTYAQADKISNSIANGLVDSGVKAGDHVALLMDNHPRVLLTYFALGKMGAIAVPVNTASKGQMLEYYLRQSDASTLIVDAPLLDLFGEVRQNTPLIKRLVMVDADSGDPAADVDGVAGLPFSRFKDLLAAPASAPGWNARYNDTFCLFFTSGTTGPSKAIISPHAQAISGGITRAEFLGYSGADIMYTCLPLFHANAAYSTCMSALVAGATIAVSRRFSASQFWQEVRDCDATAFNLLGAMVNILWSQPPGQFDRAHRVRQCTTVPVPSFAADFERRFNLKVVSIYSLTDFSAVTVLGPNRPPEKALSAGTARPEVDVAILDEEDRKVATGETGEICVRSQVPWISGQGYYKMPEATVRANRNNWFHTGDRGYFDLDGYLYFVDRQKDAIRRRGENISSWEVEQIVGRHPVVAEVSAFAVRSELTEDEVMVCIVPRPGVSKDPEALTAFCIENMPYFMVPRFVEFVDSLPKTATQKVEKNLLRASAEKRLDAIWDRERAGIIVPRSKGVSVPKA